MTEVRERTASNLIDFSINKGGFVPLYIQIQDRLMDWIGAGKLTEGDLLPSEEELSRQCSVSRMTARQALQALKSRGYAISVRGRGTFVSKPKYEKNMLHLQSFTGEMIQKSVLPSSRVLENVAGPAGDEIGAILKIPSDEPVMRLRRLRFADGNPVAVEVSHLSLVRFPGINRVDYNSSSLYQILREAYGVRVGWADELIEAVQSTREESRLLAVPQRSSLLSIKRIMMLTTNEPVEYACSLYRGDMYKAKVRLPLANI